MELLLLKSENSYFLGAAGLKPEPHTYKHKGVQD